MQQVPQTKIRMQIVPWTKFSFTRRKINTQVLRKEKLTSASFTNTNQHTTSSMSKKTAARFMNKNQHVTSHMSKIFTNSKINVRISRCEISTCIKFHKKISKQQILWTKSKRNKFHEQHQFLRRNLNIQVVRREKSIWN